MNDPATSATGDDAACVGPADDAAEPANTTAAPQDDPRAEPAADDEGAQDDEDALEEIELDGKTWRVPSALKDGYLRQADYTRKTQDVAERGRFLSAREQEIAQREQAHVQRSAEQAEVQAAMLDLKADIRATQAHIDAYEALIRQARDSGELAQAQDLTLSRLELKERLEHLNAAERQHRDHLTHHEHRASQAMEQARQAEIIKGAEALAADPQIRLTQAGFEAVAGHLERAYGIGPVETLSALADPRLYRVARDAAELGRVKAELQALKRGTAEPAVRPATTVGAAAGAGRPATTDPRSDRLPTNVWMAQERERQRRRAGR